MNKWKILIHHTGGGTYYKEYRGLSTWPLPVEGVETGDVLVKFDTREVEGFADGKWYPQQGE